MTPPYGSPPRWVPRGIAYGDCWPTWSVSHFVTGLDLILSGDRPEDAGR